MALDMSEEDRERRFSEMIHVPTANSDDSFFAITAVRGVWLGDDVWELQRYNLPVPARLVPASGNGGFISNLVVAMSQDVPAGGSVEIPVQFLEYQ